MKLLLFSEGRSNIFVLLFLRGEAEKKNSKSSSSQLVFFFLKENVTRIFPTFDVDR